MPALEVADIFRRHGESYRRAHADHLSRTERRVMGAIEACRTAALGGHVERCAECGLVRISYNSCRDRHCPKCQGSARAAWLAERQAELLPVPYFHVVFTLPAPAAEIAFQNKAAVYAILFRATAETLRTIAADQQAAASATSTLSPLQLSPILATRSRFTAPMSDFRRTILAWRCKSASRSILLRAIWTAPQPTASRQLGRSARRAKITGRPLVSAAIRNSKPARSVPNQRPRCPKPRAAHSRDHGPSRSGSMLIEAGFDVAFECPAATPLILQLSIHPSWDARPADPGPDRLGSLSADASVSRPFRQSGHARGSSRRGSSRSPIASSFRTRASRTKHHPTCTSRAHTVQRRKSPRRCRRPANRCARASDFHLNPYPAAAKSFWRSSGLEQVADFGRLRRRRRRRWSGSPWRAVGP